MASRKSPLRDRLLSNSPDPIKSSILRESGMGWNSPPAAQSTSHPDSITSPLRIAKRDSPVQHRVPDVARRSSSSFKHVRNNNLVSKSPFKSQIPTPSTPSRAPITFPTRRVSGEKRPRPMSMHDQSEAENERPFALKRERKQSKGFQGLIEREPVTKSPFKVQRNTTVAEERSIPPPPVPVIARSPLSPPRHQDSTYMPAPSSNHDGRPSPSRSSLVSKRLHGPRLSGGSRRERRKTVSFDERCDVVEFDREDSYDGMDSADDSERYGTPEPGPDNAHNDGEEFFQAPASQKGEEHPPEPVKEDASYESIALSDVDSSQAGPSLLSLDPDASITGLVDEMFSGTGASHNFDTSVGSTTSTPPRQSDIPTDLETEDGVPFGRSHHVERFLQHQQRRSHSPNQSPIQPPQFSPLPSPHQSPGFPFNFNLPTHASPLGPPATPPRNSPAIKHSTPPLGRSTHVERIKLAKEEENLEQVEEDVCMLPGSPSPMKRHSAAISLRSSEEGLVPRFDLFRDGEENMSTNNGPDPFALPSIQDEPIPYRERNSINDEDSINYANPSPGNTSVTLDQLNNEKPQSTVNAGEKAFNDHLSLLEDSFRESSPAPSLHELSRSPALYFDAPPPSIPTRPTSPEAQLSSSLSSSDTLTRLTHTEGRHRINKEDVRRRLRTRRSQGSPSEENLEPEPETILRSPAPSPRTSEIDIRSYEQDYQDLADETDKDIMSVMTALTDASAENAVIETAEKINIDLSHGSLVDIQEPQTSDVEEFGVSNSRSLQFDFGSKFGRGLGIRDLDDENSFGLMADSNVMLGNVGSDKASSITNIDMDMDMRSALDRLMDDVAGASSTQPANDSMMTDELDSSYEQDRQPVCAKTIERAATDTQLLVNPGTGFTSRHVSVTSTVSIPPPVPPKDNIRSREQMIIEKRREARRIEEGDFDDDPISVHTADSKKGQRQLGIGRPSRRRSMSTGDADDLAGGAKKRGNALLDINEVEENPLSDSIEQELKKLVEEPPAKAKTKYHVREHEGTIYASSNEKVSHMSGAGDLDVGRAWRTVRKPSDMNEYSKQIKEYRAQQNPATAYGKVFVKVLGIKGMHLPLPQQPTMLTCTLNNGIHFVTTPECQLAKDCLIEQEFELIEHSKLEFTLTMKIRRDPHIIAQYKALSPTTVPAPPPPQSAPVVVQPPSKSGMRSFFSSSPKKSREKIAAHPPPPPPPPVQQLRHLPENLARYLKPDGTLARAFISFKDVAARCDTRLFETSYPLIGQRVELGSKLSTLQVGELVLQIFRLPPLPGIPQDQLPQSLEDCHRGLRHINWHKTTYFQGTLTQSGGDCSTWRRRQLRVIGANLVAFNDVTKRATATIDLKKAIAVEDDQDSRSARSSRYADEYDGLYGVERSFRLIFPQDEEIIFFADTDEEKGRWLEVLRALVGHIPPHPLWAEILWQRQEELSKRTFQMPQHGSNPAAPQTTG